MQRKNSNIIPFVLTFLLLLLIIFGILGVYQLSVKGESGFKNNWEAVIGTIYFIWQFFSFSSGNPEFINWPILIAKLLAAFLVSYGILYLLTDKIHHFILLARISIIYRIIRKPYIIICGLSETGYRLAINCLNNGKRNVVILEKDKGNPYLYEIRKRRGIILSLDALIEHNLKKAGIFYSEQVLVSVGHDSDNIKIIRIIDNLLRKVHLTKPLKIKIVLKEWQNYVLFKDAFEFYYGKNRIEIESFNLNILFAKSIFDAYPFYFYKQNDKLFRDTKFKISIVGYNKTAESFILENSILSQSPGPELEINLFVNDASSIGSHFFYKFPYLKSKLPGIIHPLINLNFIELTNGDLFSLAPSDECRLRIADSNMIYLFGEDDAVIINQAKSIRQFLYTINGKFIPPIIACLPENNNILEVCEEQCEISQQTDPSKSQKTYFSILERELNVSFMRLYRDSCSEIKLIDENENIDVRAKIVNYLYFLKYEIVSLLIYRFPPSDDVSYASSIDRISEKLKNIFWGITKKPIFKIEGIFSSINNAIFQEVKGSFPKIQQYDFSRNFSIESRWNQLSDLKKDSNRYVARHIDVKINSLGLQNTSFKEMEISNENILEIAENEHKRWMAEKLMNKFRYGEYPENKNKRILIKNYLKIHDCIRDFADLDEKAKPKDSDICKMTILLWKIKNSH